MTTLSQTGADAGSILISAGELITGNATQIGSSGNSSGAAGDVLFDVGSWISDGSFVSSGALGTGASGDVIVSAAALDLAGTFISTNAAAGAETGDIRITADSALIRDGGGLSTFGNPGAASGQILINAGALALSGTSLSTTSTICGTGCATGAAGAITINAQAADFTQSFITTSNAGDAIGGGITIDVAGTLTTSGGFLNSDGGGAGGANPLQVNADILLANGTGFFTGLIGTGTPSTVLVTGRQIRMDGVQLGAQPNSSDPTGTARGGLVSVVAEEDLVIQNSFVTTTSFGLAAAGDIFIAAGGTAAFLNTSLTSDVIPFCVDADCSAQAGGGAGTITLIATDLLFDTTLINTDTQDATGGLITLAALNDIVFDGSVVTANSNGTGSSSGIAISADGAFSATNTNFVSQGFASGAAGPLVIGAGTTLTMVNSAVNADARGTGSAGLITMAATNQVLLDNTILSAEASFAQGTQAGFIVLAAEDVAIVNGSSLNTSTTGPGAGGNIVLSAGTLSIVDSSIAADSVGGCVLVGCGTGGDAGAIIITADDVLIAAVNREAAITSDTATQGNAGGIAIRGRDGVAPARLLLTGSGSGLASRSFAAGNAGIIDILASDMLVDDFATITTTTRGSGTGGDVNIVSDTLTLASGGTIQADTEFVCLSGDCGAQGGGGSVTIETTSLVVDALDAPTFISADALADGDAGTVTVRVDGNALVDNGAFISSDSLAAGDAGSVVVDLTGDLVVRNGGFISSDALDAGNAGSVGVSAAGILLDGGAISSQAAIPTLSANAGSVLLSADQIFVTNGGFISSAVAGAGFGGAVAIDVGALEVTEGGFISANTGFLCPSSSCGDQGRGGDVLITANSILLAGIPDGETFISADTRGSAQAGNVDIDALSLAVVDGARISSQTSSLGSAGNVTIVAGDLIVADQGTISADTSFVCQASDCGAGSPAGNVDITAARMFVSGDNNTFVTSDSLGTGNAGSVTIRATELLSVSGGAFISSQALAFGDANSVVIDAGTVRVSDNSYISSDTSLFGAAGAVDVTADLIELSNNGAIQSRALNFFSTGNAGSVLITAGTLAADSGGRVSSSTEGAGDAGSVDILAGQVLLDGGTISSGSTVSTLDNPDGIAATGGSGDIIIDTNLLALANGGSVETNSVNPNAAGEITIFADRTAVFDVGSGISSSNVNPGGGDAGSIFLTSGGIVLSEGGAIETNSVSGAAGDIAIVMPEDSILLLEGEDAQGRIETSSGPGTGGRIFIANPFAIIQNGGIIRALGQARGANVNITSDFFIASSDRFNIVEVEGSFLLEAQVDDVSSAALARQLNVVDASRVLRGQCPAQRSSGMLSQFTVRPVGPYAPPTLNLRQEPAPPLQGETTGGCL